MSSFKSNSISHVRLAIGGATLAAALVAAFVGCSDDNATTANGTGPSTTFNPGGSNPGATTADGGNSGGTSGGPGTTGTTDGGCPNTPAGCFCGAPTTQLEFLNRCTSAAALPVNLTVKPATTANIP